MHSRDLTSSNIEKLAELFPAIITESRDVDGNPIRAVDFDALRQELSDHLVEGPQERYRLDWPGKRAAAFAANAPIAKTLRPMRGESIDFDTTKNIFIEGDNLEALKLLQESYLGKIKLIYIDPPYNTGKDFVYKDDFTETFAEYLERSGQTDGEGVRLVSNAESNGRFHSDWLSMMYPRLKLARNLLSDDGVIFISIDDSEVANLREICDEVFSKTNFAAQIIWKKRNSPPNDRVIAAQHDYILAYVRNGLDGFRRRPRSDDQIARYKNPDNHPKGPWVAGDLSANVKGGRYVKSLSFPIVNPTTGVEYWPPNNGNWRFNAERIAQLIEADELYFGIDGTGAPKVKRFLSDIREGTTWTTLWDFAPFNTQGSQEMDRIFGDATLFESPKPVGLLRNVLLAATDKDSTVLDFFAGSSSMAHAVMEANAQDSGSRNFIMVQLPEPLNYSGHRRDIDFENIAQLSRERIRRAGIELREGLSDVGDADTGFRAFVISSSNIVDVTRTADNVEQLSLSNLEDSVKPDRTSEDLLFQVLLDWGLELSLPIVVGEVDGHETFDVDDGAVIACFDAEVGLSVVREIADRQPLRAVFRDSAFGSDDARINAEQIFREVSPDTDVRVI